jgi:tellurite resistance protein TehA-like permease
MLATLPAGMLVLAVAWGRVGPEFLPTNVAVWIDIVLLAVGVVIATGLGIAWAGAIAANTNDLSAVNGGWLIPPVMNLIVPLGLVPVMALYPEQAPWLLVVGFAFLGIGTVLFLTMFALLVARLALRPRQLPQLAPSLWIPLAPAGILGFALLKLLQAGAAAGVEGFTSVTAGVVVASMGIGLGLWWALFAGYELRRLRREGGVPFHPGWWGYVFPIAAMTLSISAVGTVMDAVGIEFLGAVAAVILLLVWATVAVRTLRLVRQNR